MSGLGTGRCGHAGCENPCPRDEDFCCSGCEEAAQAEDEAAALAELHGSFDVFGPSVVAAANEMIARSNPPSTRERIEALPRYTTLSIEEGPMPAVRLDHVLALFDRECSLCEQGHVPARPCGSSRCASDPPVTVEQMRRETSTYPRTEWNEDAGIWVEWECEGIGKVTGPPDDAVERRVEPGF